MKTGEKKKTLSMTTQILIATVGGIVFGSIAGPWAGNLKFIGTIFMRLIQMSVVILVMTAVAGALGSQSGKGVGKMGFHTFKWFGIFTLFAAILGYVLCQIIKPGVGITIVNPTDISEVTVASGSITDTILGFFSTNIISSMASGAMVPCIIFAIIFGAACSAYTASSGDDIIIRWLKGMNAVVLNIIKMVMKLAPIGVFCLLADVAGAIGFKVIFPMIKFLACLAIGDLIMLACYLPLAGARCKVNPLMMPKKFLKVSMLALTTTSSAICLPTKMEDSVTKFGVSRRVSDFVGPLAMSMNSNGAALCDLCYVCFLSQACGITLTVPQIIMAVGLAIMLCLGTITVPGGAVVTMTFLATSLGLPVEAIGLLMAIDWFSGMFRTLLNVDADIIVAMLVANSEGEFDRDVYNEVKTVEYNA
ncbi:dicarboxylate/amino acid:cation symporter [Lachnospiraceae bacterium 62-35]